MATRSFIIPQPNRYTPVCPPGYHQNADDYLPCVPCVPGYFQNLPGQLFCDVCPVNTYSSAAASTDCTGCPSNSITLEKGATAQVSCICQLSFYAEVSGSQHACLTVT